MDELVAVSSPSDAYRASLALVHEVLVEAARRRQDELPGLVETLQDDVVQTAGGTSRAAYGWFAADTWRYGDRQVHELFLNADHRRLEPKISPAEGVLVTLLHEACHVWAHTNGIKDTSRDGRYHNRRYAEIALAIGVQVEKDMRIGHRTPRLTARGRVDYDDLLVRLKDGLVLAREPQVARRGEGHDAGDDQTDTKKAASSPDKYVFASCQCRIGRRTPVTIRVANGSWRPDVIRCSTCNTPFTPSP
jgi:hypothetical protein